MSNNKPKECINCHKELWLRDDDAGSIKESMRLCDECNDIYCTEKIAIDNFLFDMFTIIILYAFLLFFLLSIQSICEYFLTK